MSNSGQINSNSVLVALLDSHYTELSELVEKALLLRTLEDAVGKHNITIFAPRNEALERDLDPEFKRFLLEPGNLRSLQTLLMFHIIPNRIGSNERPMTDAESTRHKTLSNDHLHLTCKDSDKKTVDLATVIHPDAVIRPDGVIHGIERLCSFLRLEMNPQWSEKPPWPLSRISQSQESPSGSGFLLHCFSTVRKHGWRSSLRSSEIISLRFAILLIKVDQDSPAISDDFRVCFDDPMVL
ncbi:hypothetical protein HHK36_028454 [Tetracentron sinense]|uniref:FAS1 domain-containing protein n=1 Tax=Tetracentron sinense TaxID=13715 RepID=A0A835D090_TETSI|nr:hypothetical protein HHK36_028454 [Tetracentron sinense]